MSEFKLDTKIVGDLVFKTNERKLNELIQFGKFKNRIRSKRYRIIDLNVEATDVCLLPNGYLLVISKDNKNITILNKDYKQIRLIDKINNQPIYPSSACTNNIDRIYISDSLNDRLIMCDLDFNFIKYSNIVNSTTLRYPFGLCFKNDFIYVCGYKRIHKFNSNLEQHTFFQVDIHPWQIQIINNIACISSNSISFYDLQTFNLLIKYDGHGGNIFSFGSYFYEYSGKNKTFYIYDQYGKLLDEILTDGFNNLIQNDWYHGMTFFNGNLVISTLETKKLIII